MTRDALVAERRRLPMVAIEKGDVREWRSISGARYLRV